MNSRIPEPPSEMEAEGIPDPEFGAEGKPSTGVNRSSMVTPGDEPAGADEFGTTAREQAEGESLTGRLDRERPDVIERADTPADETEGAATPFDERAGQGVGRLVQPDEGARTDVEKSLVAEDVGTDLGGYTAEEQAMHPESGA